jgi:hypothetical protein
MHVGEEESKQGWESSKQEWGTELISLTINDEVSGNDIETDTHQRLDNKLDGGTQRFCVKFMF